MPHKSSGSKLLVIGNIGGEPVAMAVPIASVMASAGGTRMPPRNRGLSSSPARAPCRRLAAAASTLPLLLSLLALLTSLAVITSDSPANLGTAFSRENQCRYPLLSGTGEQQPSIPAVEDAERLSGTAFAVAIAAERYEVCCCIWSEGRRRE